MTQAQAGGSTATTRPVTLIDADVHPAPDYNAVLKHMPAALAKRGWQQPGSMGFGNPHSVMRPDAKPPGGGAIGSDPAFMLEHHFDAFDIDYGILNIAGGVGVSCDYRFAAAAEWALNEYMLETWLAHDERLYGAISVSPQWPEEAARAIRHFGGERKFVQVMMSSASNQPYGQVRFWPIYEAAVEMGLPVAIHPGHEGRGITGPPTAAGWPSSYFEWHTDLPQSYWTHLVSLVVEGVFHEFPDLTFVAVEGGIAWMPSLMWRVDKNWKALRETTPWLDEPPSAVIRRHIKLTTQPIEEPEKPEHLLQIIDMIGCDEMIMFSSDYPHWDGDSPKHGLPKLPDNLRRRIMVQNALDLYKLPTERKVG